MDEFGRHSDLRQETARGSLMIRAELGTRDELAVLGELEPVGVLEAAASSRHGRVDGLHVAEVQLGEMLDGSRRHWSSEQKTLNFIEFIGSQRVQLLGGLNTFSDDWDVRRQLSWPPR